MERKDMQPLINDAIYEAIQKADLNLKDPAILRRVCRCLIRLACQMIFERGFTPEHLLPQMQEALSGAIHEFATKKSFEQGAHGPVAKA